MDNKKIGLVKFSISIRRETRLLLDKEAFKDNRSRSSLIDKICSSFLKEKENKI